MSVFENRNLDETFFYRLKSGEEVLWSYENARASGGYRFASWVGLVGIVLFAIFIWAGWIQEFSFEALKRVLGSPSFWFIAPLLFGPGVTCLVWFFLRTNRFAYAVTNQRVFVMNSLSPICLNIYTPDMLRGLVSFEKPTKGTGGTVVLDQSPFWLWNPIQQNPPRLSNIPEPHKVRALIEARVLNSVPERTAA